MSKWFAPQRTWKMTILAPTERESSWLSTAPVVWPWARAPRPLWRTGAYIRLHLPFWQGGSSAAGDRAEAGKPLPVLYSLGSLTVTACHCHPPAVEERVVPVLPRAPRSWEEGVSRSVYLRAMMILSSILERPAQVLGWGSRLVIRTCGPSPSKGRNTSKPACKNTYWEVLFISQRPSAGANPERRASRRPAWM